MNSRNGEDRKAHDQVAPRSSGLTKLAMALCLVIGLPLYSSAQGIYTGQSVGNDGTVYGWGITNLPGGTWYTHYNYVSSTLTSPNGRHASCGMNAYDYARCDVSLPFDQNDTGTFTQQSTSSVNCSVMGWYVWNVVTSALLSIGHSENWCKFDKEIYDPDECQYNLLPDCCATCQSSNTYLLPPCSNGSDDRTYMEANGYYWKRGSTRYCILGLVVENHISPTPGTCGDHD